MKKFNYQMVEIHKEQQCDFCKSIAKFDGKTKTGPWAFMCNQHFKQYGLGLGLGKGQQLIIKENV